MTPYDDLAEDTLSRGRHGDFQCWVFGLFFSARDPVDWPSDRRRWSNPDGKTDLAAVSPRTADGRPDLSGWWVTGPNRRAAPNFPGLRTVTEDFANLAWTPNDGRSTNF